MIESIDYGQDLIYEEQEEMKQIEMSEEIENLINESEEFSENEIDYIKHAYATYYNGVKFDKEFDKENIWTFFR